MALKHKKVSAAAAPADAAKVGGPDWNDPHVFDGGNHGSILWRDTTDTTNGSGWIQSVGVGQVLASAGVGTVPAWTATPTLTDLTLGASGTLAWSTDVKLTRDAANTLAQRNGTAAQVFRTYNTFTDASNYERGTLSWSSNVFRIGTYHAGTGVARQMTFATGGTDRWTLNTSGHLVAEADNTYDIGSGASRPRDYNGGRHVTVAGTVRAGVIGWTGSSSMTSAEDGRIVMTNAAGTDFLRLQFGGTTSSFPALKRNSASLNCRLADDSGYANFVAGAVFAGADTSGQASTTALTNAENTGTARSTGVGTIKFADGTARDNVGFIKVMVGTTARYIPVFAAN